MGGANSVGSAGGVQAVLNVSRISPTLRPVQGKHIMATPMTMSHMLA